MSDDRRDSRRFPIHEDLVHVHTTDGIPLRIKNLSASGGLFLPVPSGVNLEHAPLTFTLNTYPAFSTRVLPVRQSEPGIGIHFLDLGDHAQAYLCQFLTTQHLQENKNHLTHDLDWSRRLNIQLHSVIQQLLAFYCLYRKGILNILDGETFTPCTLQEKNEKHLLVSLPCMAEERFPIGQRVTFLFAGENALNRFGAEVLDKKSGLLQVSFPQELQQSGFRNSLRFRLGLDSPLLLEIKRQHSYAPLLIKRILGVGDQGFSIPLQPKSDLLFPGEHLPRVTLALEHGAVNIKGVIRSVYVRPTGGLGCGVEILKYENAEEAQRWRQFVFKAGHPYLQLGNRALVPQAWQVLERAGYVELASPGFRTYLAQKYFTVWDKLAERPQVSRFMVLTRNERPLGTAAFTKLYPQTWMAHHFGLDRQERNKSKQHLFSMAREIYSGTMYLLEHLAPCRHFVFYADSQKGFHRLAFENFLHNYPVKEDFLYDGYTLYKCLPLSNAQDISFDHPVRIVTNDPALLSQLSWTLQTTLPPLEFNAYALSEEQISLSTFSQECKAEGHTRERHIFFGLLGNTPLAALIAEIGEDGCNIFSLMTRCWIVPLREIDGLQDVKEALLKWAVHFYASKGKREFLYFTQEERDPNHLLLSLGYSFIAHGLRWLARREIIPAYLNYVRETMGMFSLNDKYSWE